MINDKEVIQKIINKATFVVTDVTRKEIAEELEAILYSGLTPREKIKLIKELINSLKGGK